MQISSKIKAMNHIARFAVCSVAFAVSGIRCNLCSSFVAAQSTNAQSLQWVQQFGSSGWAVATDGADAVYLVGQYQTSPDRQAFLNKYSTTGDLIFARQFGDGVMGGSYAATSVSVDGLGSIFITGGASSLGKAFLARYNADGDQLWHREFGDEEDGSNVAWGVSADGLGSVFVTGELGADTSNLANPTEEDDLFLAKYDIDGNEHWIRRFGPDTGFREESLDVATDLSGNAYVVGSTFGDLDRASAGKRDVYFAKYDGEGIRLWTRQFGSADDDRGNSVFVTELGDIYITGSTSGDLIDPNRGDGDAFLAKYDVDGSHLWTRQFGTTESDNGLGVDVDSNGIVYVAGNTSGDLGGTHLGDTDVFVAAFDPNGESLWTHQFGASAGDRVASFGTHIGIDGPDFYVAGLTEGSFGGQVDGLSDGFLAKFTIPEPTSVALIVIGLASALPFRRSRSRARVVVAFVLACLITAPADAYTLEWVRQFGRLGLTTATDGLGSVYLAGNAQSEEGDGDVFLSKYSTVGDLLWAERFGEGNAAGTSLSVDGLGNVLMVGGYSSGGSAFITKYNDDGDQLWHTEFPDEGERNLALGVAADGMGNVFVTGELGTDSNGANPTDEDDLFLAKYDVDGNQIWIRRFGENTGIRENSLDVAVDLSGNAYIVGTTGGDLDGPSAGGEDSFLAKYDSDGNRMWTRQLGSDDGDNGRSIFVTELDEIFISGSTLGDLNEPNAGRSDAFLAKYDDDGSHLWTRQFGTTEDDYGGGVAVDQFGNAFVAGVTGGDLGGANLGNLDYFVATFDSNGQFIAAHQFGTSDRDITGFKIAELSIDGLDYYVAGTVGEPLGGRISGTSDAFLAKFTIPEPSTTALALLSLALLAAQSRRSFVMPPHRS